MAFLIQYFYVVGACQFAMEGVHLLVTLSHGITRVWKKWLMLAIGWGLPLLISVIAIIIATDGYGPPSPLQKFCWLSFKIGTWWSMHIPIGLVQLFGIVCVIVIGVLQNRVKDSSDEEEYKTFKSNFVAFVCVLILYIVTWLFAFMELDPFKTKMPYLFLIFHALLGIVISLLYCTLNYQVRLKLKTKISPN
ncbi:CD97 antigen-like [Anneissia japonica]|uniref:CD97 antigen-like n=1 Tax=Anneissia japonica TaxID=1529436 RepID=UPI0014255DA9|nr:CD97 antigen-like [Anneissia japonica]